MRTTKQALLQQIRDLQDRFDEAQETLRALRSGEVDAIVVSGRAGDQVYTLKGADEAYRVMVEGMAEGAATLAADGLILFSNNQLAAILGRPLERVIGSRIQDLVTPDDLPALSALLGGTGRRKTELRLQAEGAEFIPAYLSVDDLLLNEERCLSLIVTDLTEQKRNEAIVAEERFARSVLEQAGEAILVLDPNGHIIRSSRAADLLAGMPVLGLAFGEMFRASPPDSLDYAFREILTRAKRGEAIRGIEAGAVRRDGRKIEIRVSGAALSDAAGGLLGYVVTLTDLTGLKRAEEALRLSEERRKLAEAIQAERQRLNDVLEMLPVMVSLLTPDHQVRFANRSFRDFFGDPEGRRCFECVGGRTSPCPECQAFVPLKTKAPHHWEWSGAASRHADVYNLPFTDVDGSALMLEVAIDVTERKQVETELARHREQLEGLVKERTRELEQANAQLQAEIAERKQAEEGLRRNREWLSVTLTSIGDAVLACDTEYRITFMNPVAASLTGWAVEDALGQPIQTVFNIVDERRHHRADDLVGRVFKERRSIALANKSALLARDGRTIPIEDSAAPILDGAGNVTGVVFVFHDVTAQRQAQAALAAAHAESVTERNRLLALMEALPVGVALLDGGGAVALSNAAYRTSWADSRQPVAPHEWAWSRAMQKGETVVGQEIRIERTHGEAAVVLNSAAPVRDAEGRITGSAVAIVDITERKRAEEARRESQSRLEAVFAAIPGIVLEYEPDGRPARANEAALRAAGFADADFTREHAFAVLNARHLDGSAALVERLPASRALRGETVLGDLYSVTTADGVARVISTSAAPVLRDGKVAGAVALWHDVTDLKRTEEALRKSEERFRAIYEHGPSGIAVGDLKGRLKLVNPAFAEILGYAETELMGMSFRDFTISEDLAAENAYVSEMIDGKRDHYDIEKRYLRKDGEVIWVAVSAAILRDADGHPESGLTIVRDITERKRLEELLGQHTAELERARDEAQAANKAKTAFLAHMTHELRTPLNSILGFSNLLLENCSLEQKRDLEIINRSGEHLLGLVNDVLDLAKIEAGQAALEIAACDLKALVRDEAATFQMRAAEKLLEIVVWESPEVPQFVRTDAPKLRQILINLLSNAVKFTERGSVILRLNSTPPYDGQFVLTIDVEDTGIGISPEDQGRIFEEFVQVSTTGKHKGTGLGLAITRRFVRLMGGNLRVESALGKGSRFQVDLTVELAQAGDVSRESGNTKRVVRLEAGLPECRVLIVEDQRENWMLLQRLLENAGFRVLVAEDGEQGVRSFQEWHPQFIWMDLRMPVMDGVEATRRIRALPGGAEVKIAAVTAAASDRERNEAREAGLDDYVLKPYQPPDIYDCMARHLPIRYRTAEPATASTAERPSGLRPADLAALPDELLAELRDAVTSLDVKRISEAIDRIAQENDSLALALRNCAESYAFTAILNAVVSCQQPAPKVGK